jgi:hypothetical protein
VHLEDVKMSMTEKEIGAVEISDSRNNRAH